MMSIPTTVFVICFIFVAVVGLVFAFDNLTLRNENTALRRRNESYRRRLERQISISNEALEALEKKCR